MAHTIGSLRDGDEERRVALGRQAFGGTYAHDPEAPTHDAERVVAAYDGDELVGAVVTWGFGMRWGSRSVPCGGVAGVVVAPEARGSGLARRMLAEAAARMHDRGEVVSALFPTTATLYRSVGFEFAGWWRWGAVPVTGLAVAADASDALAWRRVAFDDPALAATYAPLPVDHDGWLDLPERWWAHKAHRWSAPGANRFAYVGSRDGVDEASVVYRYGSSEVDGALFDLEVEHLGSTTGAAGTGAALDFLARNGTTGGRVGTSLPDDVLAPHVPHLQRVTSTRRWAWMLRLVDVAGAIGARGWPRHVAGRIAFDVVDDTGAGAGGPGTWALTDGVASWEPGGPGTVEVHVRELAALYAGCDPRRLVEAGRLRGIRPDEVDLLRAAWAATPSAVDFF